MELSNVERKYGERLVQRAKARPVYPGVAYPLDVYCLFKALRTGREARRIVRSLIFWDNAMAKARALASVGYNAPRIPVLNGAIRRLEEVANELGYLSELETSKVNLYLRHVIDACGGAWLAGRKPGWSTHDYVGTSFTTLKSFM